MAVAASFKLIPIVPLRAGDLRRYDRSTSFKASSRSEVRSRRRRFPQHRVSRFAITMLMRPPCDEANALFAVTVLRLVHDLSQSNEPKFCRGLHRSARTLSGDWTSSQLFWKRQSSVSSLPTRASAEPTAIELS